MKGMACLSGFNQQFIFSIIIITLGYFLKRMGWLKASDGEAISRLIFNLTLPALIIVSFHDLVFELSLVIIIITGLIFGFVLTLLGIIFFDKESKSIKGMLVMMIPGYNVGLFAYPLVEGIWGTEGIRHFGMFDVGNAFIVFGLAYLLGSYYSDDQNRLTMGIALKKLSNSIPLMTYLVIFILNILSIQLPSLLIDTADIISSANMPLSLLLLGIYVNFNFNRQYFRLINKFIIVRYGFGLLAGLSLYFWLPVAEMIRATLLIGAVLPIPLSLIPYGVEFGYDKRFIGTTSNVTMLLSFLFIWLFVNIIL